MGIKMLDICIQISSNQDAHELRNLVQASEGYKFLCNKINQEEIKVHSCTDYKLINEYGELYEDDKSKTRDLIINFIERIEIVLHSDELAIRNHRKSNFIDYLKSRFGFQSDLVIVSTNSPVSETNLKQFLSNEFSISEYEKSKAVYTRGYFGLKKIFVYSNESSSQYEDLKDEKMNKIYFLLDSLSSIPSYDALESCMQALRYSFKQNDLNSVLEIHYAGSERIELVKSELFKNDKFFKCLGLDDEQKKNQFLESKLFMKENKVAQESLFQTCAKYFSSVNEINQAPGFILVLGSAYEHDVYNFIKSKFNIEYNSAIEEYNSYDFIHVFNFCDGSFKKGELKSKCEVMKSEMKSLYLIEYLNPRPQMIDKDMNVLLSVFTASELRKWLKIVFTGDTENWQNVKEVFSKNDLFFSYLGIMDEHLYTRNFSSVEI
jgi:hypothetical protein